MPLFSIVIPIYNSEKYIKKCLLSVLKQKFTNYEILIINDCSTDKSLAVCQRFRKKYSFIKILNQKKNKGVSSCRNLGLKYSIGKYVIFLDADDYLIDSSLKKLSEHIKQHKSSEIIIGQHNVLSDGNIYKEKLNKAKFKNEDKIKFINQIPHFSGYCWRFVIKKSFIKIKNIFFTNAKMYEDEDFICKLIVHSKHITFFKDKFYFHRVLPTSLGKSIDINSVKSCILILESLLKLYKKLNFSLKKKIFFKSRITIILKHLYPLLFLIPDKDLKIISKHLYKNIKLFILLKKLEPKKGLGHILCKKRINFLLNCKKVITRNTIVKIKNFKFCNFYLFCMDKNSFALGKILLQNNFIVKGFLDNNKNLKKQYKLSIKYIQMVNGIKEAKNNQSYIIICNQRKEHIISIAMQLINEGIPKENILVKNFSCDIGEKIKDLTSYKI